jgi:hypothetical protein
VWNDIAYALDLASYMVICKENPMFEKC